MNSEEYKLQKFGKNIAKYRKMKHLSQNQLAEILDISREHLAKIETAKRKISLGLLFSLCNVLNVEEKDLLWDFSGHHGSNPKIPLKRENRCHQKEQCVLQGCNMRDSMQ